MAATILPDLTRRQVLRVLKHLPKGCRPDAARSKDIFVLRAFIYRAMRAGLYTYDPAHAGQCAPGRPLGAYECPRDERGWRVPRAGTLARRVYELMIAGRQAPEIALELDADYHVVHATAAKIKNPERANEFARGP